MSTRRKPQCQGLREQSLICSLCLKTHTHLTSPNTWKDPSAKQLLQSYGVHLNNLVCRPCRDDMGRCLKDSEYQPRWMKIHKSQHCSIHSCNKQVLANFNPSDIDKLKITLVSLGHETKNELKLPIPLCTSHYHQIYDAIQEKQTHCATCGTSLRLGTVPSRSCTNPTLIQTYLEEKTGFDKDIPEGARVCLPCYKSHQQMLQDRSTIITDHDLVELTTKLTNQKPVVNKGSQDDVVQRALHETVIYVAEAILKQEALLLPAVHNSFTKFVLEFSSGADLEMGKAEAHELVTARWILSNLNSTLQHHLSYCCKIRKHGTLLYRSNGDILTSLTVTLSAQNKPINKVPDNLTSACNNTYTSTEDVARPE